VFVVVEVEVEDMMGTGIMEHTLAVIKDDRREISETSAPRDQHNMVVACVQTLLLGWRIICLYKNLCLCDLLRFEVIRLLCLIPCRGGVG
jgi:hypothetical protein